LRQSQPPNLPKKLSIDPTGNSEWRNKQPGMAYRRLVRMNLIISEVDAGKDPICTDNYEHLSLALDTGFLGVTSHTRRVE
jgi:hypothetical protein